MLKPFVMNYFNDSHSLKLKQKLNNIIISIDSKFGGYENIVEGYSIKSSISLASLFFSIYKRNPTPNDVVTFVVEENVAVVGTTNSIPAMTLFNWTNSASVKIINKGMIVGRGGDCGRGTKGTDEYKESEYINYAKGGVGIETSNNFNVLIENHGLIACGGNSNYYLWRYKDGEFVSFGRPYGGAPFGKGTYQLGDTTITGAEDAGLFAAGILYVKGKKYTPRESIGTGNGGRNYAITKGQYELINIDNGKTIGYV